MARLAELLKKKNPRVQCVLNTSCVSLRTRPGRKRILFCLANCSMPCCARMPGSSSNHSTRRTHTPTHEIDGTIRLRRANNPKDSPFPVIGCKDAIRVHPPTRSLFRATSILDVASVHCDASFSSTSCDERQLQSAKMPRRPVGETTSEIRI